MLSNESEVDLLCSINQTYKRDLNPTWAGGGLVGPRHKTFNNFKNNNAIKI